ncbi:MAG: hypothetical protein HKN22_02315, partial [Bacteroidia bacterium]|nr:hypothetical protein [Bacteroidia bacterium]
MDRSVKVFMLISGFLIATLFFLVKDLGRDVPVNSSFPYDISSPTAELKLDSDLREVSGLTIISDGHIASVQDEKGHIYILDAQTGKKIEKKKFAKDGDYEGIASGPNKSVFVVRSDGKLFRIKNIRRGDLKVEE